MPRGVWTEFARRTSRSGRLGRGCLWRSTSTGVSNIRERFLPEVRGAEWLEAMDDRGELAILLGEPVSGRCILLMRAVDGEVSHWHVSAVPPDQRFEKTESVVVELVVVPVEPLLSEKTGSANGVFESEG